MEFIPVEDGGRWKAKTITLPGGVPFPAASPSVSAAPFGDMSGMGGMMAGAMGAMPNFAGMPASNLSFLSPATLTS